MLSLFDTITEDEAERYARARAREEEADVVVKVSWTLCGECEERQQQFIQDYIQAISSHYFVRPLRLVDWEPFIEWNVHKMGRNISGPAIGF